MAKKRIAFLLSDTGGGHRAAAQAISEALQQTYPQQYQIFADDVWQGHTPPPINQIPKTYPWLIGRGLPLWRLIWRFSAKNQLHRHLFRTITPLIRPWLQRYYAQIQPDIVVSVHPFMNHIGLHVLRESGFQQPFLTVVTDLVTIHPAWICPAVTHCTVPTPQAAHRAHALGVSPAQITVSGQPVSLRFVRSAMALSQPEIRAELALHPTRPTVLIIGGGEGFGAVFEIVEAMANHALPVQLLIVTGRNASLRARLAERPWPFPTRIYGFIDHIPQLMACADLLITKAGPNTISEALIARLPMILSGYIPGQEMGNVRFVEQHQVGQLVTEPAKIAALVGRWLFEQPAWLHQMAQNAASVAKPEAALTIAHTVQALIKGAGVTQPSPKSSVEPAEIKFDKPNLGKFYEGYETI